MVKRNLLARKRPGDTRKPPGRCARWVRERAHLACRPLLQREHDVDHAHEEHEHHERADLQPSVRRARHFLSAIPCSRGCRPQPKKMRNPLFPCRFLSIPEQVEIVENPLRFMHFPEIPQRGENGNR